MKRILTMTLAAALLICALSLPVLAESAETTVATETTTETTDAVASATRNNRNNAAGPQQMPGHGQKPGRNGQQQAPNQNGQQPQAPNQNGQQPQTPNQNGQQPQTQDQNGQQAQTQDQNSGNRKHDNAKNGRTGKSGTRIDPDQLLKENVISQEVYDAIMNYINSQATQPQQNTESSSDSTGST